MPIRASARSPATSSSRLHRAESWPGSQNNEPEIFAKVARCCLPKDYLRLWLTGEHISEMSDSAGTSWLDTGARKWSAELLAATGLEEGRCRRWWKAPSSAGHAACRTGRRNGAFPAGVVVAGGAGDNAASACGMGTVQEGHAFVSLGTSGVLFAANALLSAEAGKRRARLLPRAAEHLAPDGRHPVGHRCAQLVFAASPASRPPN